MTCVCGHPYRNPFYRPRLGGAYCWDPRCPCEEYKPQEGRNGND